MLLAHLMISYGLPIEHEPTISQSKLEPPSTASVDDDHQRQERSIAFRPLFAYREEQAHNNHPVHRRHIIEQYPIDNIPIYDSHHQNNYPYYSYQ